MKYKFKNKAIEKIVNSFADAYGIPQEMVDKSAEIAIKLGVSFSLVACGSYLALNSDCVQEVKEYNPHGWNKFPEVTPPENVHMRLNVSYDGQLNRLYGYYENGMWYDIDGCDIEPDEFDIEFRPWDEG